MPRKGGKPPHPLTEYFYIIPNEWANKSNRKCICRACMEAVGRDVALLDETMKITNTRRYCVNHLRTCPFFAAKHSPEQIQYITSLATSSTSTSRKRAAVSSDEEDDECGDDYSHASFMTTSSNSHVLSTSSTDMSTIIIEPRATSPAPIKKQAKLSAYVGRPLRAPEVPKFERLLLRATISTGFAFRWVENPEVKALFHFLCPHVKLPDRKTLADRILKDATNEVQTVIKDLACKDQIGVTIAFDGWRNIVWQELMGIVFITSSGEVLIWGAEDISIERHRQAEVISRIQVLLEKTKELNIRVNCIVTDSAASYAAARRFLRKEMRDIVFLPCFAHQANCCVGEVFKESIEFKTTSARAIRIIAFFHHSVYFTAKLREEQTNVLKKHITLITPCSTRWNSFFDSFDSIIKSRYALRVSLFFLFFLIIIQ